MIAKNAITFKQVLDIILIGNRHIQFFYAKKVEFQPTEKTMSQTI